MSKSIPHQQRARLRLSRTPEFYRSFVRDYPQSGLSIPEYCRRHHVGESTFRNYRKALSQGPSRPAARRTSPSHQSLPRMVRVLPAPSQPVPFQGFEVLFPGGALLRLPHLDESILATLAPVLLRRDA
jgi:hypothetical protein